MERSDDPRGLFDGFEGYRTPGDQHLEQVLRHGIVALDTNVLLDLYRYGDVARREFLGVLESIRDLLFIPSQVAIEFWRNRDGVLAEEIAVGARQPLSAPRSTIRSRVNEWSKRTQATDQATSLLARIDTALDEAEAEMRQVSGWLDGELALGDTARDPVLTGLERVLAGRVGDPLDATERAELIQRGEARFADKIPRATSMRKSKDSPRPEPATTSCGSS